MKVLAFEKARILGVDHKIANGNITSKLKVVADFTPKVAEAMEARWVLFDRDQIPKAGYKAIELDYELKSFGLDFSVKTLGALGTLNMTSELADRFKVMRHGDGKKKPRRLMVGFAIHHNGPPFELLEWLIRIGGAEGKMELRPLQQNLFEQEKAAEQKKAKRRKVDVKPEPVASDAADFAAQQSTKSIPSDPSAPEWRTEDEIAAGVPQRECQLIRRASGRPFCCWRRSLECCC